MSVKAIGPYEFPPADPRENYGGHLVFFGYNEGNLFFASVGTFRAPAETPWTLFRSGMLDPWLSADPDVDLSTLSNWRVDEAPIVPRESDTLASLGIGWKSVVRFNS